MNFKNTPSRATVLAGLEDEADVTKPTFSKEEFAVRVIANYCKIALKHRADFSFILDHKNISEKAVQYLAELFEIPCCDREKLILALATDAKTFYLTHYKNDSRDLLKNTSTLVRDLASELIGNSYANLLQQANWH
jgi:hypothetical protein